MLTASAHLLGEWGKLCKLLWALRKCRKALNSNRLPFTVSVSFYMTDRKLAWQTERKKKQDAIRAKGDGCENISDQLVQDFYFSVHSCIYSPICNFLPMNGSMPFSFLFAHLTVSVRFPVPDRKEISLSMLCSSSEALLCDENSTRTEVFNEVNLSPLGHKQHFD